MGCLALALVQSVAIYGPMVCILVYIIVVYIIYM